MTTPENQREAPQDSAADHRADEAVSRRLMLRRALGKGVPVVATLASGPVSAGICLNASGFVSTPTFNSRHPNMGANCSGNSPATWQSSGTTWPSVNGINRNSTTFNATLAAGLSQYMIADSKGSTNPGPKLQEVLDASTTTMAAYIVAAWLNASAGLTGGVFTPDQVVAIWKNIVDNGGGYRLSAASPVWSASQTMDWLALSWGVLPP